MSSDAKPRKVLIIGLDGATLDIIRPMAARGELPNLSALMDGGAGGELASTIQPTTPQAWTTFMTGCTAARHGIFDFIERVPRSHDVRFVNGSFKQVKSIWGILSERGLKVGVVNVPFTYPPEEVNGVMISGFDAPGLNSGFVYPPEFYEEIVDKVGPYELRGTFPIGKKKADYRVADIDRVVDNRTAVSKYIMRTRPWDVFMVVYGSTDHVQHVFWRQMMDKERGVKSGEVERFGDIIAHTYRKVDEAVGELVASCPEGTVVAIMSDHGGGELKKVINLNNWLCEEGLLAYRKKQIKKTLLEGGKTFTKKCLSKGSRDWIKSRFPGLKDRTESLAYFAGIDWAGTRAYSWGMYGNISVNLRGREYEGTVRPEDFEKVRGEIKDRLMKLRAFDGEARLVERVWMREELYSGPLLESAPDIIIEWKDYSYYTQGNLKRGDGSVFLERLSIDSSDFEHTGTHRLNGTLVLQAAGVIKKGVAIEGAGLADVAPTILYIMGQPVPGNMDGRVLTEVFEDEFMAANGPVRHDADDGHEKAEKVAYSDDDKKEMEEKLKGLGYL